MSLTFTGERFLPECAGEMVYEHWHRYLIAQNHVSGCRVLDVASGEGYGSHLLAQRAASVVGVDLSSDAVAHAATRYQMSNLRYVAASCLNVPEPDASFDVIVSFETIEHIAEHEAFLREVDRLLAPGGLFVISSPNRPEYSDRTGYKNEFHVKELDRDELRALLDKHFTSQKWFAQRAAFHSMVWPLNEQATSAIALTNDGDSGYPAEVYYMVFCARSQEGVSPVPPQVSLVTDRELSVYSEWSRTYEENVALHAEIKKLRANLPNHPVALAPPALTQLTVNSLADPFLVRWAKRLSGIR